jgi:hypothetical protein
VLISVIILIFAFSLIPTSFAHQDGCHSKHSCPSDSGKYTCGDTGNCSECPDNQYCNAGNYNPLDVSSKYSEENTCTPGLVCFREGNFLKYESFLGQVLFYKQTYTYEGIIDNGKIAVHNTGISVSNGNDDPPTISLIEMNLCCGIVVDGQYDVLQPSPVNIDRWLKHETSADYWKNKVSESSYDFNGKIRKIILVNNGDTKEFIDKETGVLLYRTGTTYGGMRETIKLVDTNIITYSNSNNLNSEFVKPKELIFSKSFSTQSSNTYKDNINGFSFLLPSNWEVDQPKFSGNEKPLAVYLFNKDPEKAVRIEINFGAEEINSKYSLFQLQSDDEILNSFLKEEFFKPSPGLEYQFTQKSVEKFQDGLKIRISFRGVYLNDSEKPGYPFLYDNVFFILKNGKQYSLLLGGQENKFNQNSKDFESVINSFYADSGTDSSQTIITTQKPQTSIQNSPQKHVLIPSWIKNNAKWWSDGQIKDLEFLKGIEYLVKEDIIKVKKITTGTKSSAIPSWIKNNAKWWSEGKISEDDFIKGIKYLVENGLIQTDIPHNSCKGTADCISGKVTKIVDGDTLHVNGQPIRLALTATPELDEKGGQDAKSFTNQFCSVGSSVIVDEDDKQTQGSYDRLIGQIFCNGKSLNEALLENNLAIIDSRFCSKSEFSSESWAIKFGC